MQLIAVWICAGMFKRLVRGIFKYCARAARVPIAGPAKGMMLFKKLLEEED